MKRKIQRSRINNQHLPAEPHNFPEIHIPLELQQTLSGGRFLFIDNNDAINRIIVFCSDWQSELMRTHTHWHCDGTFKTALRVFYQLYTFHIKIISSVVPVL
ncbi:hypothetical protein RF11_06286 [Thelohanellus kitauei]|uniref:Uncharacterized protein n=1 Tax=Thelohanellus kitauei TaxID=669202 RepID=A0A0C2MVA7_THEKT|nr:hypothetical protein RF11_06286 [Thelohanellus kitauei]